MKLCQRIKAVKYKFADVKGKTIAAELFSITTNAYFIAVLKFVQMNSKIFIANLNEIR